MTQNKKKENQNLPSKSNNESNSTIPRTSNKLKNGASNPENLTNYDKLSESKNDDSNPKRQKSNFIFINIYVDSISYLLIVAVIYSSYLLFKGLPDHVAKVSAFRPEYPFPTYSDLLPTLYILIILMLTHTLFKYFTVHKLEKCLSKRYDKEEIEIYKHKVSTNIIKFSLYLSSTILGYLALKDLDYFPWSLGGSGDFPNVFSTGYPGYLFFEKPALFDFYYNFNLAFALFDTHILLTYPLQSDFLLMVLHHLVTFTLVVISFLVNFSSIGSIIYFVHYSGDVLSILVRICIHLNIPEVVCCYLTIVFLAVFVYTRLFVFGHVLFHTYTFQFYEDYSIYSLYLCSFAAVLMILNVIWIVLISKKVVKFLLTGKVEEIYKFKKAINTKKDL